MEGYIGVPCKKNTGVLVVSQFEGIYRSPKCCFGIPKSESLGLCSSQIPPSEELISRARFIQQQNVIGPFLSGYPDCSKSSSISTHQKIKIFNAQNINN